MARESLSLAEKYISQLFALEDADLARTRDALKSDNKFGINVGAPEGKLLQFLVGLIKPRLIVEIGTLYGYSTLWMAKALGDGGKIISVEFSAENFARAKDLIGQSKLSNRIELVNADAKEWISTFKGQPDLIFIDADKPGYKKYLDWAMSAVRVGGVIIGDNTFLFGHMIGDDRGEKVSAAAIESMRYFNETLAKSPNFRAAMIPTHEGMTVAERLK